MDRRKFGPGRTGMPDENQSGATLLPGQSISFDYCNWRGERARRTVTAAGVRFGVTEWHPSRQWLLLAFDEARGEFREFALADATDADGADIAFAENQTLRIGREEFGALRLRFGGGQGWLVMVRGAANADLREIRLDDSARPDAP